mmetsp:Transcript_14569/g.16944  ORF Transcript_14569/g.16944 Transcript_14569/m.16944 type:complete len:453 (-) Transcript_14569:295-1653(-)
MTALPNSPTRKSGTSTEIMNMSKSRSSRHTASTISTIFNPLKRSLGIKKRLSKRGTNALFRAISAENWELVCTICDTKPYKAEAWHNAVGFFDAHRSSRILPLHQACIFHPTEEAIRHLIQACPHALRSKENGYGRVPLHIACHSNASLGCIKVLVAQYPNACIEQDVIGRVPLHYALSNGASYDVVKTLMNSVVQICGPSGLRRVCSVADFNGWLPIHVACFMGASPQVVSALVKAYPEGVHVATKKSSTPRSLLKAITMSPPKKDALEAILLRKPGTSSSYASRVSPVRTDMEKVVKMSDETCSKGVTLEIDEGETSSLSSMEETAKTAFTKKSCPRRLTYGEENMHDVRSSSHRKPLTPRGRLSEQLPTHSIYEEEAYNNSTPESNNVYSQYHVNKTDVYFPPDESTKRSYMTRKNSVSGDDTQSNASTDDEESCNVVFQPISSTATFC